MIKIKYIMLVAFLHSGLVFAFDISKSDQLFATKQFELAREGYLEAAQVGNPHAYFQLARIYFRGLGVEQDIVDALIYYSLAAEYDFLNSKSIIDGALSNLPEQSQAEFNQALTAYKKNFGREQIEKKFFPLINKDVLDQKITFDGEARLEKYFENDEFIDDSFSDFDDSSFDDDEDGGIGFIFSTPAQPFLVVDIDIAPEGYIRHHSDVQKMGYGADNVLSAFSRYFVQSPSFQGRNVNFIHRAYLGAASFKRGRFRSEHRSLYTKVRRAAKNFQNNPSMQNRYQYAMLLMVFEWLDQEDGEAERELLSLAKEGYPLAMYEYGMMLYREQRNISEGIYWIGAASKYGLSKAQYRLGKILQTSPWVFTDNKKALFWYEFAADKNHLAAKLRAIDIKLTSSDKSIADIKGAIDDLVEIGENHKNHPEYYYLLGLSYLKRDQRDFSQARSNLRNAIRRGKALNWNVDPWENLLNSLTSGTVISCEKRSDSDYDCVE